MRRTTTVAVINSRKRLLILRRGITAPWMPGKYCLPGGHIEINEDSQYAATRELSEETGISFPVDELDNIRVFYGNEYSKIVYIARVDNPSVKLNYEHDDYQWINFSDSNKYELVPRLLVTIKTLYRNGLIG